MDRALCQLAFDSFDCNCHCSRPIADSLNYFASYNLDFDCQALAKSNLAFLSDHRGDHRRIDPTIDEFVNRRDCFDDYCHSFAIVDYPFNFGYNFFSDDNSDGTCILKM